MSIRNTLKTSGFYIHYNKKNWLKSSKDTSFLNTSFREKKQQMKQGFDRAIDPYIYRKVRTLLEKQGSITQSLLEVKTNIEKISMFAKKPLQEGVRKSLNLNKSSSINTHKIQQIIQSEGEAVGDLIYIQNFVNSLSGTLKLFNSQGLVTGAEYKNLYNNFNKLSSLVPKIKNGDANMINQFITKTKNFAKLFIESINTHAYEIGEFLGNNVKSIAEQTFQTISKAGGQNTKITYSKSSNSFNEGSHSSSFSTARAGVKINFSENLGKFQGNMDVIILETDAVFQNGKVVGGSYMFNNSQIYSYDDMFGAKNGLPAIDGRTQNWFLNYYVHQRHLLNKNSVFMNYLKGRGAAFLTSSSGQIVFFNYKDRLYTINQILNNFKNLIDRYFTVTISGRRVNNVWEGNKTRNITDAEKRSQNVYNEIRGGVHFSINMNANIKS